MNYDHFRTTPFTVVIDSNETAPFPFQGFTAPGTRKAEPDTVPLLVPTVRQALWAHQRREVEVKGELHSVGFADYSLQGYQSRLSIERKSLSDLYATLSTRRQRFEAEIKRLHEDCLFASVVVEADLGQILNYRETGLNPASVIGTITAWKIRYPRVHWDLLPGRAAAERWTFRLLDKFWTQYSVSHPPELEAPVDEP